MRTILFALLAVLLVAVVIELTSAAVYRLTLGAWPDRRADHERRQALLGVDRAEPQAESSTAPPPPLPVPGSMVSERVHPFLGFVQDYPSDPERYLVATPWGFYRRAQDPPSPPDAYRIGVVGGSAAFLFSFKGSERLIDGLRDAPFVAGRPIEVVSLALGGYKQPQQLMTLAWLLSEGERFDLIVNLDGFNEVAFGAENAKRGVYPSFPRNWSIRLKGSEAFDDLEALGRAAVATSSRRELAGSFAGSYLGRTVTGNLVWRLLDRSAAARIQHAEAAIAASMRDDLSFAETGPPWPAPDDPAASDAALYGTIARQWRRSSVQLDRLSRGSGMRYVHLLQPNQYLAGSKPMGAEERAIAIAADHPRREAVEKGYPVLRAESERLRDDGVDFHDLTQMYASVRAVVYEDSCCHVNQLGNELIADALVDILLSAGSS